MQLEPREELEQQKQRAKVKETNRERGRRKVKYRGETQRKQESREPRTSE